MKNSAISTTSDNTKSHPVIRTAKKTVVFRKAMSSVATEFIQISYPLSMISHDYLLYRHVCWLNPHFGWCLLVKKMLVKSSCLLVLKKKTSLMVKSPCLLVRKKMLVKSPCLSVKKNMLVKSACLLALRTSVH